MSAGLILLTAGGTAGHVFPAEALASELRRRGHDLAFVTDRRGAHYGGTLGAIDTYRIHGGGVAGKSLFRRLNSMLSLIVGYCQARRLLGRLKPAVVVGFGGYASVPAVLAANHRGTPTVIHEQNGVLGRANRMLAGGASRIAVAYDLVGRMASSWQPKVRRVGMPVRPAVQAMRDDPYPPFFGHGPLSLLVMGGSQGAKIFAELVPHALLRLPHDLQRRLFVHQQCRLEDMDHVAQLYRHHGIAADIRHFFDDVPARLKEAHLVIARAGASTVAELEAIGRPAILVPYPFAADDHQTANASAFAASGAGWLMPQGMLSVEKLADHILDLLTNPSRLQEAARQAHQAALPDAAARLADLVLEVAA